MSDEIVRYYATITVGDEFHSVGEEHIIDKFHLEDTKEYGLKLEIERDNYNCVYYHLYPCTIRKIVYKLKPIEISAIDGGDRMGEFISNRGKIGYCSEDFSSDDWTDHWC